MGASGKCVEVAGSDNRQTVAVDCIWNVMAHAQKPDFVFRRNGRVHLNRRGRHFSRLLTAEVRASAVVMLDTPCSEVVWRVLATHFIRQFPLHFPSLASPCAITFQLVSTPYWILDSGFWALKLKTNVYWSSKFTASYSCNDCCTNASTGTSNCVTLASVTRPHGLQYSTCSTKFKKPFVCIFCRPGSSVGTATRYRLDGPGIESPWRRGFPHLSRPALGPRSLLYNGYRVCFTGVERPGRGVDHTPSYSAEDEERVELLPLVACLLQGEIFTFYFFLLVLSHYRSNKSTWLASEILKYNFACLITFSHLFIKNGLNYMEKKGWWTQNRKYR
jgi:hypothetical protein